MQIFLIKYLHFLFQSGREGSWTPDSGVTSRKFTASLHDHMFFRFSINRITLLMQYFIERLGNHSTSFTARSYTCTLCGCLYSVLRGGFGIAPFRHSASDFHGSLTITNNVLKATTKVTCGVARLLSAATMRLVYMFGVCAVECISVFWLCLCRFSPPLNPCQGYRLL